MRRPTLTARDLDALIAAGFMIAAGEPPDGDMSEAEWYRLPEAIAKLERLKQWRMEQRARARSKGRNEAAPVRAGNGSIS